MTLLAMFGVVPPDSGRPTRADATMDAFVAALKNRDRRKVASFFCTSGKLHLLNTLEKPYLRTTIDCGRADELDDLLFGDDGLRDYMMMAGRRPWRRKRAMTFLPPYATGDPIHVRWRRDGDRLVIHEIAMPSA